MSERSRRSECTDLAEYGVILRGMIYESKNWVRINHGMSVHHEVKWSTTPAISIPTVDEMVANMMYNEVLSRKL